MYIDKFDQSTFLVLKAAYLYYISEKPQTQIAEELGISVTTVSRLLKRAKEEKIIELYKLKGITFDDVSLYKNKRN